MRSAVTSGEQTVDADDDARVVCDCMRWVSGERERDCDGYLALAGRQADVNCELNAAERITTTTSAAATTTTTRRAHYIGALQGAVAAAAPLAGSILI